MQSRRRLFVVVFASDVVHVGAVSVAASIYSKQETDSKVYRIASFFLLLCLIVVCNSSLLLQQHQWLCCCDAVMLMMSDDG